MSEGLLDFEGNGHVFNPGPDGLCVAYVLLSFESGPFRVVEVSTGRETLLGADTDRATYIYCRQTHIPDDAPVS
jgi:hypothetical protein